DEARALDPDLEVIITYPRKPAGRGELEERAAAALARRRARVEREQALRQLCAQLRRIAEPAAPLYLCGGDSETHLRVGRLELDLLRRRATIDRRAVPLSGSEFDLLLYMARRDNQVLSAKELARAVLHYPCASLAEARELIKVRIHRLRQKIEVDPRTPGLIVSVRGAGYMLNAGSP
ncbi:MAG: winged helix-turn-helix transcriptional regulator, partial [Chloroflexales bacterium]|nr:winged helix-turn-helix transcriptional regulator [Chloroflexales bacterium]